MLVSKWEILASKKEALALIGEMLTWKWETIVG